jgi:hypothetical protein
LVQANSILVRRPEATALVLRSLNPLGGFNLIDLEKITMGFFLVLGILVLMFSSVICGVMLLLVVTVGEPGFTEDYLQMFGSGIHMVVLSSILLLLIGIYDEVKRTNEQ